MELNSAFIWVIAAVGVFVVFYGVAMFMRDRAAKKAPPIEQSGVKKTENNLGIKKTKKL